MLPTRFNAENMPAPLFLTDKASASYFWKSLAKPIRHSLVNKPYAMENHKNGASLPSVRGKQQEQCVVALYRCSITTLRESSWDIMGRLHSSCEFP